MHGDRKEQLCELSYQFTLSTSALDECVMTLVYLG